MSAPPRLVAGPLEGRPFRRDDWPFLLTLHTEPATAPWLLAPGESAGEARARRAAEVFAEAWAADGAGPLIWRQAGRIAGYGGLRRTELGGLGESELLIALAPAFHGRGLAKRIGRAILGAHGPRPGEPGSVIAQTQPDNVAALRLCARLGFREEDTVRREGAAALLWRWRPEARE